MAFHSDPNRVKRTRFARRRLKAGNVLAVDLLAEFVDFVRKRQSKPSVPRSNLMMK